MINNGRWYSQYTPGYPLLLLPGVILGAPWIINPLLAAIATILIFFLGKEIYGERIGLIASLLASCSIWFLLMSASMMSHTGSLFFTVVFLLFFFRSLKTPSVRNGTLLGMAFGMSFLIRPYNAIMFALPFGAYYTWRLIKAPRTFCRNAVAIAGVISVFVITLLAYNQLTNGDPLKMGYIVSYGKDHGLGFGRAGYVGIPYTPYIGAIQIFENLKELNKRLFGWPISSFLALVPLVFPIRRKKAGGRADLLLTCGFFSLLIGLYFYWGNYVLLGPRMMFETVPVLLLLSARGIDRAPKWLHSLFKRIGQNAAKRVVTAGLLVCTAYGFLFSFRDWVWPRDSGSYYKTIGRDFQGVTPRVNGAIEAVGIDNAVVIIKLLYFPKEYFPAGWWGSGFLYDDPDLRGKIVYVNDRGEGNARLFDCFPDRHIYIYYGTLDKGMFMPLIQRGDEVVWGPPIANSSRTRRTAELLSKPMDMFYPYSPDYSEFLDDLFRVNPLRQVDVAFLLDKGAQSMNAGAFALAAHYFEAVLQVEKLEEPRSRALNQLVRCYNKLGKTQEARRIVNQALDPEHPLLYGVFPEKGF